jgi:hypothetical protein
MIPIRVVRNHKVASGDAIFFTRIAEALSAPSALGIKSSAEISVPIVANASRIYAPWLRIISL